MKALTLHQPWASLVMVGRKLYETRSWSTPHRGLIAIHAGKSLPDYALDFCDEFDGELAAVGIHDVTALPLGVVLGCVRLTGCIATDGPEAARLGEAAKEWGNWDPGRYAWRLEGPSPYGMPIAARGMQGLWDWKPPGYATDRSALEPAAAPAPSPVSRLPQGRLL